MKWSDPETWLAIAAALGVLGYGGRRGYQRYTMRPPRRPNRRRKPSLEGDPYSYRNGPRPSMAPPRDDDEDGDTQP